ncbi:DUF1656 domain-containing protein [Aureimonas leprariae]|uniref:DUF1656 domain-containing protein n=1 Tax=Plantimonas leprariae TaxID=2615207 RepID=A0A7V7PM13_9HYPH|nr:DUF1656 domain-containing protein [Aureimonas leprariae]KAB0677750.1 DUF1656 domain-containing protein [Aureimonas leprariae]
MRHELSAAGLFFPSLLLCAVIAGILWFAVDRVMLHAKAWSLFWHPPLARLCLLLILFGAVSALYPDF